MSEVRWISSSPGQAVRNPEFFVMKHFARFIDSGAVRLGLRGPWAGNALAFANPDGGLILTVANPFAVERVFNFAAEGTSFRAALRPCSVNTFHLPPW